MLDDAPIEPAFGKAIRMPRVQTRRDTRGIGPGKTGWSNGNQLKDRPLTASRHATKKNAGRGPRFDVVQSSAC